MIYAFVKIMKISNLQKIRFLKTNINIDMTSFSMPDKQKDICFA